MSSRIGKYEIVGELGRGTMGEVYKARDPVLNRFVALKTLTMRAAPGDETLERFQREATRRTPGVRPPSAGRRRTATRPDRAAG